MTVAFTDLLGQTLTEVIVHDDEIIFETEAGNRYKQLHQQDCCESVWVEDVCGDTKDLLGRPVLVAEESTECDEGASDSGTWTFYRLATSKGWVTIRWCGQSNGYYSESVGFIEC